MALSKSQVDKLGERLRAGPLADSDLRLLDEFRSSFGEPYEFVVDAIRKGLELEPTGRPEKSTLAIIDKLRRDRVRLTQIQDIAGCRIVAVDIARQHVLVQQLCELFLDAKLIDRISFPSHGYMAAHLVVQMGHKLVEIQVRSTLQHMWAELSEKLSDTIDASIKYGGGPAEYRNLLSRHSDAIRNLEGLEVSSLIEIALEVEGYRPKGEAAEGRLDALREQYARLMDAKSDLTKELDRLITDFASG